MTLAQMQKAVEEMAGKLGPKALILLDGPLGAGKTQFVTFLVEALGGEKTASPTFAIHNVYQVAHTEVHHLDLYRLESEDDLESTGFWDLFNLETGYIAIEWAERLNTDFLPKNWPTYQVRIGFHQEETERIFSISKI